MPPRSRASRFKTQASSVRSAIAHLRRSDPVLSALIRQVGPFTLKPNPKRFELLVRSIVSQQISVSAARAILGRLQASAKPRGVSPERLAMLDSDELRAVGLSRQKAAYLSDLAEKCATGSIRLNQMGRLTDERVIEELTQVKGIGRWTAQMFLIFALGRLDVFPHDDLGIRSAIRDLYGLDDLPDRATSLRIADPWRPYATVASWYCWRSIDLRKKK